MFLMMMAPRDDNDGEREREAFARLQPSPNDLALHSRSRLRERKYREIAPFPSFSSSPHFFLLWSRDCGLIPSFLPCSPLSRLALNP